jgi:hypothetical protein
MEDQNAALPHAEQDASDPVARQRRALAKVRETKKSLILSVCRACRATAPVSHQTRPRQNSRTRSSSNENAAKSMIRRSQRSGCRFESSRAHHASPLLATRRSHAEIVRRRRVRRSLSEAKAWTDRYVRRDSRPPLSRNMLPLELQRRDGANALSLKSRRLVGRPQPPFLETKLREDRGRGDGSRKLLKD